MNIKSILSFSLLLIILFCAPLYAEYPKWNTSENWDKNKIFFLFKKYKNRKNHLFVRPVYTNKDNPSEPFTFAKNIDTDIYEPILSNKKNYKNTLVMTINLKATNKEGEDSINQLMKDLNLNKNNPLIEKIGNTNTKIEIENNQKNFNFSDETYKLTINNIVFKSLKNNNTEKWQYNPTHYKHAPFILTLKQVTTDEQNTSENSEAITQTPLATSNSRCFAIEGPRADKIIKFETSGNSVLTAKKTGEHYCFPAKEFGDGTNISALANKTNKLNCIFNSNEDEYYECHINISKFCDISSKDKCKANLVYTKIPLSNIPLKKNKSLDYEKIELYNLESCGSNKNTRIKIDKKNKTITLEEDAVKEKISIKYNGICTNHSLRDLIDGKITLENKRQSGGDNTEKKYTFNTNSDLLEEIDYSKIEKNNNTHFKLNDNGTISITTSENIFGKVFTYNYIRESYSVKIKIPKKNKNNIKFEIYNININNLIPTPNLRDPDDLEVNIYSDSQCTNKLNSIKFSKKSEIYISGKKEGYKNICRKEILGNLLEGNIQINLIRKGYQLDSFIKNNFNIQTKNATIKIYPDENSCKTKTNNYQGNGIISANKQKVYYSVSATGYQRSLCKEIKTSNNNNKIIIKLKKSINLSTLKFKLKSSFYGNTFSNGLCDAIKITKENNSNSSLLFKLGNNGDKYIFDKSVNETQKNSWLQTVKVKFELVGCDNIILKESKPIVLKTIINNNNVSTLNILFKRPFFLGFVTKAKWRENYGNPASNDIIFNKDSKLVRNGWFDVLRSLNNLFINKRRYWQNGYLFDISDKKLIELHNTNQSSDNNLTREALFNEASDAYNKMSSNSNLLGSIKGIIANNQKIQSFDAVVAPGVLNLWINIQPISSLTSTICSPYRYDMSTLKHTKLLNIFISDNSTHTEWLKTLSIKGTNNDKKYIICPKKPASQVMTIIFSGIDEITRASNENDPNNIWKKVLNNIYQDQSVNQFMLPKNMSP